VLGVLDRHANAVYLVLGIDEFPPFFPELASGSARRRVLKLGWQSDYLNVLGIADVVVDTFPSGGGIVNLDAAALSIPVVSYRHDYFRRYDQMDWSPGAELLPVDELLAPRGRFDRLQSVLSSLAEDPALRRKLGDQCRRIARKTRGSPARYVRRCESVYRKVLKQKLVKPSALGSALSVARRRVLSRTRRLLSR
jgi:glycosyltransferase involved in cell wall biosynthesis